MSFQGDPHIWIVDDPEVIEGCPADCQIMHEGGDCTIGPHVQVKREVWSIMPVSKLRVLYHNGVGQSFVGGHHWDCKCEACA